MGSWLMFNKYFRNESCNLKKNVVSKAYQVYYIEPKIHEIYTNGNKMTTGICAIDDSTHYQFPYYLKGKFLY